MAIYWVEFEDRKPGCIETDPYGIDDKPKGEYRDVLAIAADFGKVKAVHLLPYPREPRLGVKSDCPSFCFGKRECLDKTACPQNYACSE